MADEQITTPVKPGYFSSEFWLSLAAVIIAAVLPLLPSDSKEAKIAGILAAILAALGYTASRAMVKSAASKVDAAAMLAGSDSPSKPAGQ